MAREHDIALKTVHEMVYSGKPFAWDELQQKIIDNDGILRISPGFTIGQYINELEEDRVIKFKPDLEKFVLNKNLNLDTKKAYFYENLKDYQGHVKVEFSEDSNLDDKILYFEGFRDKGFDAEPILKTPDNKQVELNNSMSEISKYNFFKQPKSF